MSKSNCVAMSMSNLVFWKKKERKSNLVSSSPNPGESSHDRDCFDLYDLDKDGLISASELHEVMERLGLTYRLEDCVRMISNSDADGDGHVNFEEFKKMMNPR